MMIMVYHAKFMFIFPWTSNDVSLLKIFFRILTTILYKFWCLFSLIDLTKVELKKRNSNCKLKIIENPKTRESWKISHDLKNEHRLWPTKLISHNCHFLFITCLHETVNSYKIVYILKFYFNKNLCFTSPLVYV